MAQPNAETVIYAPTQVDDQLVAPTRAVPSQEELKANLTQNRLEKTGTGRWATYIKQLRSADFDANGFDWIKYVPNSRYQYVNRLLKRVKEDKKIGQPDLDFLSTFWMDPAFKKSMLEYFGKVTDKEVKDRFEVVPQPDSYSKSFRPVVTKAGLRMIPSNPGIHNIEDDPEFIEFVKKKLGEADYNRLSEGVHRLVTYTLDKYGQDKDEKHGEMVKSLEKQHTDELMSVPQLDVTNFANKLKDALVKLMAVPETETDEIGMPRTMPGVVSLASVDKDLQRMLTLIRRRLNEGKVSFKDLHLFASGLQKYGHSNETSYLMALLDPWRVKDAKVPELLPIPTASFKIRSTVTLTTNASGNIAFVVNPFFLSEPVFAALDKTSSFGVNNDVSLTGTTSNDHFVASPIGQVLPANMYKSYRLVSAAIKMIPVGSALTSSGFITAGLDLDGIIAQGTVGTVIADYAQYGAFQTVENLYFHHSEPFATFKPVQVRWVPKDKAATEYRVVMASSMTAYPTNFMGSGKLVGYGQGLPSSSPCLKLDFVANFEAIVAPINFDYIPSSFYRGSYTDYEMATQVFTPSMAIDQNTLSDDEVIRLLNNAKAGTDPVEPAHTIQLPPREDSPSIISSLLTNLKSGLGDIAKEVPWASLANQAMSLVSGFL